MDSLAFSFYPDNSLPPTFGGDDFWEVADLWQKMPIQVEEFAPLPKLVYKLGGSEEEFGQKYAQVLARMISFLAQFEPEMLGFWSVKLDENSWEPPGFEVYSLDFDTFKSVFKPSDGYIRQICR